MNMILTEFMTPLKKLDLKGLIIMKMRIVIF